MHCNHQEKKPYTEYPYRLNKLGYIIKHLSDAPMSERQDTATANQQNQRELNSKLQLFPMQLETVSSTILQKIYHRTLFTRTNQILKLLLLLISNQKKGKKSEKLQMYLHLHLHLYLHWRGSRNSPTLQDPESQ